MRAVAAALKLYRVIMDLIFFISSILLGIGLAMDAFAISVANGISKPDAKLEYAAKITVVYALFQFAMPMLGWLMVHEAAKALGAFNELIPWIALMEQGVEFRKLKSVTMLAKRESVPAKAAETMSVARETYVVKGCSFWLTIHLRSLQV